MGADNVESESEYNLCCRVVERLRLVAVEPNGKQWVRVMSTGVNNSISTWQVGSTLANSLSLEYLKVELE